MGKVLVEDGNILVTEDGRFFRMSTGKECTITVSEIKGGGGRNIIVAGVITYRVNGKRFNKHVHRLYAEAFLTQPSEKHTIVSARDGNLLNLTKDNIYWLTNAERVKLMHERLDKEKVTCPKCGYRYYNKGKIKHCSRCEEKPTEDKETIKVKDRPDRLTEEHKAEEIRKKVRDLMKQV